MNVRHLVVLTAVALLSGCATPTKARLDAEVDRLCALNGGIQVYETVPTGREHFDKYGFPDFLAFKNGTMTLGPEYVVRNDWLVLVADANGNTSLGKHVFEVSRTADAKVLGRNIFYYRPSRDIFGLPDGGHSCARTGPDILQQIFVPKD